jgi:hypothetical protein
MPQRKAKKRDQTNLTKKIRGIFSVGNQRNSVGFVGIIFWHPPNEKIGNTTIAISLCIQKKYLAHFGRSRVI